MNCNKDVTKDMTISNQTIIIKKVYIRRDYMLVKRQYNNMNGTAYNHTTQSLNIPYTLIQPVIPGKQLTYETLEQRAVWHYEDFILDIMKVMDLQCIAHCTDDDYQLITIQGADDTLIHIKPSKTLRKRLLKQKEKARSIKTGVNRIQQTSLLVNGTQYQTSNLVMDERW